MDKRFIGIVDYLLIMMGLFLILDSLYLHYIVFDYGTIGLAWLDPWFNHWMIGALLVLVALRDLGKI
ncbi:MAG: hypothetical protein JXB14_08135 [Candidatus Altiarchaeota archaeon]|nr:hypothetical protein [Candidatus Altiarchaeota archaeon]